MANRESAAELGFVVKICGVTNENDLESSVEAGANAIGFNFYPKSPRYLNATRARRLAQSIPGEYLKVGVFVNPTEDEVLDIAAMAPLDVVQLHGDRAPLHLASTLRVWRSCDAGIDRGTLEPDIEAWLLDTPTPLFGGSGKTYDWRLAAGFPRRFLVAGGLDAENVAAAIEAANPWGVDACSKLESAPGQKDPQRVKLFVQNALAALKGRAADGTEPEV